MDRHLAHYMCRYYRHLMTDKERLAHRHLFGTLKATKGRSDMDAQEEARKSHLRDLLSDDPAVLDLTREGSEAFLHHTAERILADHADKIHINRCPRCGKVARTPKARQCWSCMFDWHTPA